MTAPDDGWRLARCARCGRELDGDLDRCRSCGNLDPADPASAVWRPIGEVGLGRPVTFGEAHGL